MKLAKKVIVLIVTMALILGMSIAPVSALSTPSIAIDGSTISISASYGAPFIDSANRIQVPVRVISEKLGAKVTWDAAAKTAIINGNIKVKLGSREISTPYGTISMDTAPVIKSDRIYVPVKYMGNALGYKIDSTSKDGAVSANIITKVDLTISAAASLKDAMAEIQALYLAEKPNTKLNINLGSSGSLQQQIEQGADVDLFFSAATTNMNTLKDKGLLDNSTIKDLLGNKVVLVVPNDSNISISNFSDVTNASIKRIALGEPKTVPAGQYAEQVFTYLNLLDKVKEKAVYAKDVREVLTWVETGNVDAGVVYSTDAKVSTKVKVIATAANETHKPIIYPAAVVKTTKNPDASKDFLNFLTSDSAKAVFVKYGFSIQ